MLILKKVLLNLLPIIIISVFSFISVTALLIPGLPPTHDGEYHIIRFYEFDKVLREGNFYPRWASDLNYGFGIPLFNYIYPLPNYVASFFHFLGFSFIDSFKLNLFFATIFGGIFFYLWSKQFWGTLGGIISSVFYTYSPYHFVDIYIRGSVGELWAICFFPAFLWSITKLVKEGSNRKNIILSGIFLALIIFSHNILALMFLFFAIAYSILLFASLKHRDKIAKNIILSFLLGLGLSAIFWLPAVFEKNYVTGLQLYNIRNNFPELYQLIFPSWGSGFSGSELQNQMSFQIGLGNLSVMILAFIGFVINYKKIKIDKRILLFFFISFVLVFFLMLDKSIFIWENFPFINYFQFPWRLLSLITLITAFFAGSLFSIFHLKNNSLRILISSLMISFVYFSTISYTKPTYYYQRDDFYYISKSNFIDGTNSPGNYFNTIWLNKKLKREKKKATIIKGEGNILEKYINSTNYEFIVNAKSKVLIGINTLYFPGWKAYINNKDIVLDEKDGLILINAPKGKYSLKLRLEDTFIRQISIIATLLTFLVISTLLLQGYYAKIIR